MAEKRKDALEAPNKNQLQNITVDVSNQDVNYIPPWKLNVMLKYVSRILSQLTAIPNWLVNYDDIEFILKTALDSVKKARIEK